MLSLFPAFFSFEPLGPFLLRLTLAGVLLYWAYVNLKTRPSRNRVILGVLDLIFGVLLVLGLFTQLAALLTALLLFVKMLKKIKEKAFFNDGVNYYFILFIIAISLLFIGPGAFSFDYPL
jgi:uncharacterized membrane protein YphA (DoxX/SURF4 family)